MIRTVVCRTAGIESAWGVDRESGVREGMEGLDGEIRVGEKGCG